MKITMLTVGSTGDVRPYILLGRELLSRGHRITIATFSRFREDIEAAGLSYFPLSGDAEEICPFDEPAAIAYNRDGDRLHLAGNLLLKNGSGQPYALIRGTFLVIGVSSGAYVSLTDAQIIQLRARICRDRLPYSGSNAAPCRLS